VVKSSCTEKNQGILEVRADFRTQKQREEKLEKKRADTWFEREDLKGRKGTDQNGILGRGGGENTLRRSRRMSALSVNTKTKRLPRSWKYIDSLSNATTEG